MVLFLYVIMMLNLNKETEPHKSIMAKSAAVISGGLLMVTMVAALRGAEINQIKLASNNDIGLTQNLGKVLFNEYILPFEVSSILFLGAMVGAVYLGKKELN